MAFRNLPSGPITLQNLSVPACLLGQEGDLVRCDLSIDAEGRLSGPQALAVDMAGALALPAFVDMHTHLDKGHIWARSPNPDGTFMGALTSVGADRTAHWTASDVQMRADFALRCAYHHGTRAIRTHLDSIPPQDDISWPVFRALRDAWAGRIDLQACCLLGIDRMDLYGAFPHTADLVAESGGVLGVVTYPVEGFDRLLTGFLDHAVKRGLPVDFHVDETMDASVETLRRIAEIILETGFDAPVTVGHCCSLSSQDEARALDTLDLVAKAGISVVSLPLCNLYLQDRHAGRTPRQRGITLVQEMVERGIPVAFASDNTRDPFYAYGDLDMLEVMRMATRIGHLDHGRADWPLAVSATPAQICGFRETSLAAGAPADLIIFNARSWTELHARPHSDRIVLRDGAVLDTRLPDYAELDRLMETP